MEPQRINWLELSDSQKNAVLDQTRTYLQQQIIETKLLNYVLTILHKHELIE